MVSKNKHKKKNISDKYTPAGKNHADNNNLWVYLLILTIVPAFLYLRVVNFGLSEFDDSSIINNIINVEGNSINFTDAFTHDATMSDNGDSFYRPMQILSLMIDSNIGRDQPWIYHLSNLILHIFTVVTLFFFLKMIGIKQKISFLLSLLFSVNPMLTNAVAWIPARGDMLLCFFSLLSFITFFEFIKHKNIVYLILHSVVIGAAIFSKETSIFLPVLILFYFYYAKGEKLIIRNIIPVVGLWIFLYGLFFYLRYQIIKAYPSSDVFGILPFIRNIQVIPISIGKFFIPVNLNTLPFFDYVALSTGLLSIIIFIFLIIKLIKGEKRKVIFGGTWFIVFSIPPMLLRTFYSKIGYEYFDYRAYLPIIGILLITGLILNELISGISLKKILKYFIPVLLVYFIIAYIYSSAFKDPILFFSSAINANPGNAMALSERGVEYSKEGNMEKAMSDFDNSIRVYPAYPTPYFNKAVFYRNLGDHYKAEYLFSQALKYDTINPGVCLLKSGAYNNFSSEMLMLHKFEQAITLLKDGVRKYPELGMLHNNLGRAYYFTSKFDSAIIEYSKAINIEKYSPEYYNNRGLAKYHNSDVSGAVNDYDKALDLKPGFLDALGNRGLAKVKQNKYNEAITDLTRVINTNPKIGVAWYYRGLAYYKSNKLSEAMNDLSNARLLGYYGKDYGK
jgi:protein O-mannosyl-transferase